MLRQPATRLGRAGPLLVAIAGASGVLLGAFGAHALRGRLDADALGWWHTATQYQLWHALALALAVHAGRGRAAGFAIGAFAVGIVLFSGSLYLMALGAPRWFGAITPLGGLGFIAGWIALAMAMRRAPRSD
ncbi:DUF423 domain-containing protein [Dyella sp.]|uniref:DUF423 domain-containing protein n=1 Tax=Dyella sp. TaxID=1869338 RepID=UPI002D7681E6|nr:DUF423 domain-containing protein [Dyella sp.]HET6432227.1 DUF423 domain-containing protein [Dyella sp.]